MANLVSTHSCSHSHHFVSLHQFDEYVQDILNSDQLDAEKKLSLQTLIKSDIWKQVQQSNYWRHNLFNGGLSGPFTEYFACFNPEWKVDFWGGHVQTIEITYLSEHAIPKAYQSAVKKTQQVLSQTAKDFFASGKQHIEVASLACGTMYDVLGTSYENGKQISFHGFDVDTESLRLAQEKARALGYDQEQVKLNSCDVTHCALPENQYDVIVCNGFSFYIKDDSLCQLIENVKKALKRNGIFLMSFIQPPVKWQMSEEEKKADTIVKGIVNALPKKWSSNLRTSDQVLDIVKKGGLTDMAILEEQHGIHPLLLAYKR